MTFLLTGLTWALNNWKYVLLGIAIVVIVGLALNYRRMGARIDDLKKANDELAEQVAKRDRAISGLESANKEWEKTCSDLRVAYEKKQKDYQSHIDKLDKQISIIRNMKIVPKGTNGKEFDGATGKAIMDQLAAPVNR